MRDQLATAPRTPAPPHEPRPRRYELDWLRALVVLALIPVHAAGFFTPAASQNPDTAYANPLSLATLKSVSMWGISLLFLVAGAGAFFVLARLPPHRFIIERSVRLLVPFAFATLTLIPLQDYIAIHAFPGLLGQAAPADWDSHVINSPLAFYLSYLSGYAAFLAHYTPQQEIIYWSHLWLIPRLLGISLFALPLLLWLRGAQGERFIALIASACDWHRGAIVLFGVPLGLVDAVLGWQWQTWPVGSATDITNALAGLLFYGLMFVYGFLFYADDRVRRAVRRDGGVFALALGILVFIPTQLPGVGNVALAHDYSAGGLLAAFLRAFAAWLFVLAVVGLSMRFLAFTNRFGRYLTEASYPIYVLHMPALYLVALLLLAGTTYPFLRYLAMVTLTCAIILVVYEFLIRRVPLARTVFGMKRKRVSAPG